MTNYYDTKVVKCKWRELVRFSAEGKIFKGVTCHNPDAIRDMKNGAECPFHGNAKADTCDYFERKEVLCENS